MTDKRTPTHAPTHERNTSTPTTPNRERVTAPARRPTPASDPRNEVLWRPSTEDPDQIATDPPAPQRLWRP
ncbi:MAG: hypothetical protein R3F61_12775 [Myxococcota bacterium]